MFEQDLAYHAYVLANRLVDAINVSGSEEPVAIDPPRGVLPPGLPGTLASELTTHWPAVLRELRDWFVLFDDTTINWFDDDDEHHAIDLAIAYPDEGGVELRITGRTEGAIASSLCQLE